jgi:hypothetical protein
MSDRIHRRSRLPRRLAKKISAYAATVVALGANHDGSQGAIVHTDLGPGGIMISGATLDPGVFALDLDANGSHDFVLYHGFTSPSSDGGQSFDVRIRPIGNGNRVLGAPSTFTDPYSHLIPRAFQTGKSISSHLPVADRSMLASYAYSPFNPSSSGAFNNGQVAFVGLLIDIDSGVHAGWARIQVPSRREAVIFDYAYETTPGVPIIAGAVPEPPSLVLLAAGAAGLAALRRKRRALGGV